MKSLQNWERCVIVAIYATIATASSAQIFNTLVEFNLADGAEPFAPQVQRIDGNLYGTTVVGGTCTFYELGCGTIFAMTPSGNLKTLHTFSGPDGAFPFAALVLATDGRFYGTTTGAGTACPPSPQCGTVFRITAAGKFSTLYKFVCPQTTCTDGNGPEFGLVQDIDGNLYGTTFLGGTYGCGTVFRISLEGVLTTVATLGLESGCNPSGPLLLGTDGKFYGTTLNSDGGQGSVFSLTEAGNLQVLYTFCKSSCADGASPRGGLIEATDGNFYGTTFEGGASEDGTVFRITPEGRLTTLHSFTGMDGSQPTSALVQATDGNFYGTTTEGDQCSLGCGTIFEMTASGQLTTLHTFPESPVQNFVQESLVQDTNGTFFGTTGQGGPNGWGTVFSLDTGLAPFVAFVRPYGKVGQPGGILGQGFTGTTSVSLNGIPAAFTVESDTFITATVPPGATTGYVTVTTPSATLTSNVPFRVIQ